MSAKRRANFDDPVSDSKQSRKNSEFITRETAKMRRLQSQNIVNRLVDREMWGSRRAGTQIHETRRFYQNIFPNLTVVNVEKPACYLRKFSPDGKYLIAFSLDQTSLEIYEYQGVTAGLLLTKDWKTDIIPSHAEEGSNIRNSIFEKLFKVIIGHLISTSVTYLPSSVKAQRQHCLCLQATQPGVQSLHERRPIRDNRGSLRDPPGTAHLLRDVPEQ